MWYSRKVELFHRRSVKKYPVHYLYEIKKGPAAARNKGLESASKESDYIVTEELNGPHEIKIDTRRHKIFIIERYSNQISSASLDGGIPDAIVDTELSEPWGLALDRKKGIIFISEHQTRDINSVNMDGSNFKKICDSGGKFATGMFFVPKID